MMSWMTTYCIIVVTTVVVVVQPGFLVVHVSRLTEGLLGRRFQLLGDTHRSCLLFASAGIYIRSGGGQVDYINLLKYINIHDSDN